LIFFPILFEYQLGFLAGCLSGIEFKVIVIGIRTLVEKGESNDFSEIGVYVVCHVDLNPRFAFENA
jgi:hypothetical protein